MKRETVNQPATQDILQWYPEEPSLFICKCCVEGTISSDYTILEYWLAQEECYLSAFLWYARNWDDHATHVGIGALTSALSNGAPEWVKNNRDKVVIILMDIAKLQVTEIPSEEELSNVSLAVAIKIVRAYAQQQ